MKTFGCVCLSAFVLATTAVTSAVTYEAAKAAEGPAETPQPDADGWYTLFNGKDFDGWKVSPDHPDTFKVVDGEIVVRGEAAHLYYAGPVKDANFKNFEWKCDVLTKPKANSGMYFHTKFQESGFPTHGIECQVDNSHRDPIRTGSLYKVSNIMKDSPAKDDEWFTQMVIVNGRHIIVAVDGKIVNDHIEPEHPKREAGWENNVLSSGTFALQGHDPGSEVHYRKIMVKPLP